MKDFVDRKKSQWFDGGIANGVYNKLHWIVTEETKQRMSKPNHKRIPVTYSRVGIIVEREHNRKQQKKEETSLQKQQCMTNTIQVPTDCL